MDKVTSALLHALKHALAEPVEQRLYKSGKFGGLFASRAGASGEAALRAVREGLVEVVRTETRGRTQVEWVRPTPAGVEFVHKCESPAATLRELREALECTQAGIPLVLEDLQRQMADVSARLVAEVQNIAGRVEALARRVEEAIDRAESARPELPEPLANSIPWARDVVNYLERRTGGGGEACSLSELFFALKGAHPDLTLGAYHAGLRRLSDRGLVRLFPPDRSRPLPEPEYALLDGIHTYYHVSRTGNAAA